MPTPRGTLVLIGGSEDRGPAHHRPVLADYRVDYKDQEILRFLLAQTGKPEPRVAVVVTASRYPLEMADMYFQAFEHIGQPRSHVDVLDIREPATANLDVAQEWLRAADLVLFSGGDQQRLVEVLAGTRFMALLHQRFQHEDVVVAGTSAGSMAIPTTMLCRGSATQAMLPREVETAPGLGLLNGCVVDTHFLSRSRFGRLVQAVLLHPSHLGIGLAEDTALVIRGEEAECVGSGMALVIDGDFVRYTNAHVAPPGVPIYAEGMRVHCLARGNRFHLRERRFTP